jgi:hypothetical protein
MTNHLEAAGGAEHRDRAEPHLTAMHRTAEQLEAGIDAIRASPREEGTVDWIACRPAQGERTVLETATLDLVEGLVGDNWVTRPTKLPDQKPNPEAQVTLMNVRAVELVAGVQERWALAGDQLYVDLDLSLENLPAGTRLPVGGAVLEVTALPDTGCAKVRDRFGSAASRWVNTPVGRALNLRGINVRVVSSGEVRRGDTIRKLA